MEKISCDIAIIGGGIAAITFAENYKKLNPKKSVCIFEKTNNNPYSKVLLPHYVKKLISRKKLFIRTETQLKKSGLNYFKNQQVNPIDTKNSCFLTNSFEVKFNKLVIATGGEPKKISSLYQGFYLQTIEDADLIKEKLQYASNNYQACVIGGGFMSLEFFEIFIKYKLKTLGFIKKSGFFSKLTPKELTPVIINLLQQHSIKIKDLDNINEITNPFITGIGTGLTRTHNLFGNETEGVKTNKFLESKYKNIYAIGDVAIVNTNGINRVTGNWNNAIQQGIWLAKYLSNKIFTKYPFDKATDYTTSFFGNVLTFLGLTNQQNVINKIVLNKDNKFISECFIENKLVGAVLLNSANQRSNYQKAISLSDD